MQHFKHVLIGIWFLSAAFLFLGFKSETKDTLKTDEEILIEMILRRGLTERDKVPDYNLLKDKKKVILSRSVASSYDWNITAEEFKLIPYSPEKFPEKVGNVKIKSLTDPEIQKLADKKGDYLYLQLGNIKIEGNRAEIGLTSNWAVSKNTKGKIYMSGGGFMLEYVKENGVWKFNKNLKAWTS